jgi:hypothetical protein
MSRALVLLAACGARAARGGADPIPLAAAPAFYPRLLAGAPALAVVEAPNATARRLVLLARAGAGAGGAWAATGAVVAAAPAAGATDLGNGELLRLASGVLLCALRHHDGVGAARVFRIQVAASADNGTTWAAPVTIAQGPVGVWEPFLTAGAGGAVHVYYSAELTNGGEQDIVRQTSADGGRTWGAVDARVHTPGSRNGMPGVVALRDGSLLAVFEGFWSPAGWGHFTVNSARSFDGGATWPQRAIVHAPAAAAANAGAPQAAACADGRVAVIFMTSEGGSGAGGTWPAGARLAAAFGAADAANASAPLAFSAPAAVPTPGDALWPSLFVDGGAVRAAWQDAAGAAWVASDALC